jgi:hypothetical protein
MTIMDTSPQESNTQVVDVIANTLGIEPLPVKSPSDIIEKHVEDDFEYARGNMIATIEKGREALDEILDVAIRNQQARSFEVAATLIKTLADANKDLMELSKRKKELLKDDSKHSGTVNNNLFVGNASELLKMIKNPDGL